MWRNDADVRGRRLKQVSTLVRGQTFDETVEGYHPPTISGRRAETTPASSPRSYAKIELGDAILAHGV